MKKAEIFQRKEDTFNFSLGNISQPSFSGISGVHRFRDSLDSISQPNVRSFFESVRGHNSVSPNLPAVSAIEEPPHPVKQKTKPRKKNSSIRRTQPFRKVAAGIRKRRAENSLSADISQLRPCKVIMTRLNWNPSTAR